MKQVLLMNNDYIALIYEGDKTEEILVKNIKQNFFNGLIEIKIVAFPAGENIYMLYKQLVADSFETDLIELIREYNPKAAKELSDINRNNFSQIYLFFDYDGHNNNLSKLKDPHGSSIIEDMLNTFNNETDIGKLYINYPMVESLRDNKFEDVCHRRCSISIDDVGQYKNTVSDIIDFQDFRKLTIEDWKILCKRSVSKANCIVTGQYGTPQFQEFRDNINQLNIFSNQLNKYINPNNHIGILNAFPLFLMEYFRADFWSSMLND
jgi:hypothetical protein